jgi:hypothetical protein
VNRRDNFILESIARIHFYIKTSGGFPEFLQPVFKREHKEPAEHIQKLIACYQIIYINYSQVIGMTGKIWLRCKVFDSVNFSEYEFLMWYLFSETSSDNIKLINDSNMVKS